MNDSDDDLRRLRRLDEFLEAGNDIASLRDEIERASMTVKKAQLRAVRTMLDDQGRDAVVVPFDRAKARARLAALMAEGADTLLTLAARGGSSEELDALLDDLVELEQSKDAPSV